jgi:DNA-binding CsgD family transcriptional regulator
MAHKLVLDPVDAAFLLICIDLNSPRPVQAELLQHVFGLTPCEAQLAKRLSTGSSLLQIATQQGVGVGTLRGQLKSIFIKTGTNRQHELVAILSRFVSFCGQECPSNAP